MPLESSVVVGWDIGGAHTKAAMLDSQGRVLAVRQLACPLWKGMQYLREAVQEVMREVPAGARHAVTMTGELADIFPDRRSGVRDIVELMRMETAAHHALLVYGGELGLVASAAAAQDPERVASANWMASAAAAAVALDSGLLVDVGSTTSDLVPFADRVVAASGNTDAERMAADELLYMGVVRTPVMALAERAPFRGRWHALAAEHFATAADIFRLTGELPDHADLHPTADGADKSLEASARRLARMLGHDFMPAELPRWQSLAAYLRACMIERLYRSAMLLISRGLPPGPVVGAGVGRFLVQELARRLDRDYQDFGALFPSPTPGLNSADCAPAVAVAALARAQV